MNLFVSWGDLSAWTSFGNVLPEANRIDDILFSPKVIYNSKSKLYVMWFNYVPGYSYAIATSTTPYGPFKQVTTTPFPGNTTQYGYPSNTNIGDFSLFVDDDVDETAYILYSGNSHVQVERLSSDYMSSTYASTKQSSGILPAGNEAPAMFKRGNLYYALVSVSCCYCGQGGLVHAFYSTSPLGPYTHQGEIAGRW